MSWEFQPGMRVVCIDGAFDPQDRARLEWGGIRLPVQGCVYTIRAVFSDIDDDVVCIFLVEIVNPPMLHAIHHDLFELSFLASRFRPLDEKRLDVFRQHLVPAPRERATA